jgi:hypothetical protein
MLYPPCQDMMTSHQSNFRRYRRAPPAPCGPYSPRPAPLQHYRPDSRRRVSRGGDRRGSRHP